ncbi:sulfate/molybdate ABC transporter ATP-binding protein [Arthrobacter glacialis]|uniref:sulfate/molybdate ABC transporter ATP-binding protein n=1 Tax=Arthrobacter glacialis TaxID=1664 RepID=UPI000CD491C0|nr:ABC transporter ATP-binding protein [Arthrobacter glacialis]POH58396.1 molybdenum ABC transporter ATP-binding protein [Arthrobacter glacialis]
MTLEFRAALAARTMDVSLTLGPTETVAVMGPNGAGKSSVLQVLAGLLKPDSGHATLDGRSLFELSPGTTWLPPHARGLGVLAQDPLLFPHLSVLDNVAFGPRSQGLGKVASREAARHWLGEVGAMELSSRLPAQLSGGQAQRVALARALATDPELLLLDEPMAALDVNHAPFLRSLLKRVLAGRRAIIVTHSVLDALLLADRIVVMDGGRIVESGTTSTVLAHPRSAFAASLAGLNVLQGTLNGPSLLMDDGVLVTGRPSSVPPVPPSVGGQDGMAAFPPSSVSVFLTPPHGSPRNVFKVRVTELEPHGDHIRVRAARLSADISAAATAELVLEPGSEVFFVVKAAEVVLYPA